MNDLAQQRFNRLSNGFKAAILVAALILAAPLAWWAFLGTLTLIAGIAAFAIVSAAIAFAPWLAMKLANWRLKAIKAEAARNPIETMQVLYTERVEALRGFAAQIERFSAKIGNTRSQLAKLEERYPAEAKVFREHLQRMVALKDQRWEQYKRADAELQRFNGEIEKAQAIWEMAQSAKALDVAAGMGANPLDKIKAETAFESVQTSMNESFAQLERLMLERVPEPGALPGPRIVEGEAQRVAR